MKKILLALSFLGSLCGSAQAMSIANTSPLFSGVTSSSQNVIMDLNAQKIDFLSMTAAYSSATLSVSAFTDGSKSTATISPKTITLLTPLASSDTLSISNNAALVATQGSISVLVSTASQLATGGIIGSTLTINGVKILGGTAFTVGASTNATAINVAAAINALVPNVVAAVAPVGGGTVTITCVNSGSFCNSYTVASSTIAISTAAGTSFSGGNDNPSFTITAPSVYIPSQGDYIAPMTFTFVQGVNWFQNAFSSNTAISIAQAIDVTSTFVASTVTTTSVLIQPAITGSSGNSFTLVSSTGALPAGTANFIGGQDAASFTIQGITKVANIDWAVGTSSVTASTAIVSAINADPFLSTIIVATTSVTCPNNCGVVFATSTALGINNWSLNSSATAALLVSSNQFVGGSTTSVTTSNNSLFLPAHGLATGTPILLTTTAGTPPGTLAAATTYYAVVLDANDVKLATTSALATATPPVTVGISSQTANGGGSFRLSPLAIVGVLQLSWAASDDDIHFNTLTLPTNVTVSSVTFLPTAAANSTYWDFGQLNARYLELIIGGPTAGAYSLTVTPYGKSQGNGY